MNDFDERDKRAWGISEEENRNHEATVMLGSDKGNNQYYKCQDCGAVIVVEGKSSPKEERERMKRKREEEKSVFDKFMEKIG